MGITVGPTLTLMAENVIVFTTGWTPLDDAIGYRRLNVLISSLDIPDYDRLVMLAVPHLVEGGDTVPLMSRIGFYRLSLTDPDEEMAVVITGVIPTDSTTTFLIDIYGAIAPMGEV